MERIGQYALSHIGIEESKGIEQLVVEDQHNNAGQHRFRAEDDFSRVLSKDDPDRMKLSATEHENALQIKQRIESIPEPEPKSKNEEFALKYFCIARREERVVS